MNHPLELRTTIQNFGRVYAYWELRTVTKTSFIESLWLLFVASCIKA